MSKTYNGKRYITFSSLRESGLLLTDLCSYIKVPKTQIIRCMIEALGLAEPSEGHNALLRWTNDDMEKFTLYREKLQKLKQVRKKLKEPNKE